MTIYNINRGIGWASSGVEYAQSYRAKIFRDMGIHAKFIFTDMFQNDNLEALTSAMGFTDEEVVWLYQFFTDYGVCPCSVRPEEIEGMFSGSWNIEEQGEGLPRIYQFAEENTYVRMYIKYGGFVQKTETVIRGRLVRTDYYSSGRIFSEYYAPKDGRAKLYLRRFYNRDGSEAYIQLIDGDKKIYRMKDAEFFSKEEFIGYMLHELHMTSEDIVIMDRSTEIGQGLLMNRGGAKLGIVIHADHWNENLSDEQHILWNNYYEYDFAHAREVSFFITSTKRQQEVMERQFQRYCGFVPRIVTIPVGALPELRYSDSRRRHSFITASRLAEEKHIDWLVRAAALAHGKVQDLTLDIYGKGGEEDKLTQLIRDLNAEDFIHLCGHQDLEDIYCRYETYAAASTSEGFGLTLMEAVGSGLAMIGFDVPYGNVTFIEDGKNGYLIPYSREQRIQERIDALADRMMRVCNGDEAERFAEESYRIAGRYLQTRIEGDWADLLGEECDDTADR